MKIAEAFVEVRAEDSKAKADARAIARDIANTDVKLKVALDDAEARVKARAIVKGISEQEASIEIGAEDRATPVARSLEERVANLTGKDRAVVLKAAIGDAEAKIRKIDRMLESDALSDEEIRILIDQRNEASAKIESIKRDLGELEDAGEKAGSRLGEVGKQFVRVFSAAVIGNEIRKAISAASELEQAVGGTSAVFKEASDIIDDYARNSAKAVGLSERAFREATTSIGGNLKRMGLDVDEAARKSIELTEIAADLAATYGGTTAEAVAAMGAAFRGEFDSLERWNVGLSASRVEAEAVRLGLADASGAVDQYGRMQATISLILQDSADAQGQFNRELDTAAGRAAVASASFENARAKLGEQLLPIFTRATEYLTKLVEGFSALPGPVQAAIVVMAGIAVVAGPIRQVIGLAGDLTGAFTRLKGAIPAAASAAPMVAFAAIVVKALYDISQQGKEAEEQIDRIAEGIKTLGTPVDSLTAELNRMAAENAFFASSLANLGLTTEQVARAALQGGDAWKQMSGRLLEAQADMNPTAEQLDEYLNLIGQLPDRADEAIERAKDLAAVQVEVGDSAKAAAEGQAAATRATDDAAAATERGINTGQEYVDWLAERASVEARASEKVYARAVAEREAADATRQLTAEQIAAYNAVNQLATALDILFGKELTLEEATINQINAAQALTDQVAAAKKEGDKYATSLNIMTETGRANREAVVRQVRAIEQYAQTMRDGGASNSEVTAKVQEMIGQLREQMLMLGFTEDEVDAYIATLKLTPSDIETRMHVRSEEALRRIEAVKARLAEVKDKTVTLTVKTIGGGTHTTFGQYSQTQRQVSSEGRFVRGGTNMVTSVGEIPGSAGDEVIVPLGKPHRIRQLMQSNGVAERITAALGGQGDGASLFPGDLPTAGGGRSEFHWHQNAPVYGVDDLERTITGALYQFERAKARGSRHG